MSLTDDDDKSVITVAILGFLVQDVHVHDISWLLGYMEWGHVKVVGEGEGHSKNGLMLYPPGICEFSQGL